MLCVSGIVSQPDQDRAVSEFLRSATHRPSALLVEGAPGIGKTMLCGRSEIAAPDLCYRRVVLDEDGLALLAIMLSAM